MNTEIKTNYIFKGFGFGVLLPMVKFKTNARDIKTLDIDMDELKDKVADYLLTHKYAYSGAMLNFMREYMSLSTRDLASVLGVSQQTISNWEKDKKHDSVPMSSFQRIMLVMRLKQFIFSKKETIINETIQNSQDISSEYNEDPLILDDLYQTGS
jgi:DNA-binding transcriptional regulator YiaG